MARARNIKPGFFKNEQLAELPFEYRLLFAGLWILADREGRLEDRPKRIRMEVFPADDVNVDAGLTALATAGLITRYEMYGVHFISINEFLRHQKPHPREAPSTIPAPPGHADHVPEPKPSKAKALPSPADSLNPPCLNPSPTPPPSPGVRDTAPPEPEAAVTAEAETKAHELASVCAINRVQGAIYNGEYVKQWVREGVTSEHLREAIAEARRTGKPNPEVIPIKYLLPIVSRVFTGRGKPVDNGWRADQNRAVAKGREFGINPKAGEDMHSFIRRIDKAIADQARSQVA